MDSDSDHEFPSPTEETPSLINYSSTTSNKEVCVSCLASALKRGRKSVDSALIDDSEDSDVSTSKSVSFFQNFSVSVKVSFGYKENYSVFKNISFHFQISAAARYRLSSISLPTTLKKYKGHHSTESCRHLSQIVGRRRPSNSKLSSMLQAACSSKAAKIISSTSFSVASASASASCDKMLTSHYSDDDHNLESVVVSSEHDLEDLEKKLNK